MSQAPEEQVNQHLREKRETGGAEPAPVPDVPSHAEAVGMGRESHPPGQRGDGD